MSERLPPSLRSDNGSHEFSESSPVPGLGRFADVVGVRHRSHFPRFGQLDRSIHRDSTHRTPKDVIKTGGEWISSIDLENAAIAHPAVAMAAVIGVKHPKWDERPLMFVVRKPGQSVEKEEILSFLETKVAKWWVPDDVIFLESLPVGGTGKVQKGDLRKTYGGVFS